MTNADRVERDELRAEQQREMGDAHGPVPLTTPAASPAQTRGMTFGALVGAAIGLILVAPLGFIEWADIGVGSRVLIAAIVGAVAGATVGAVYGGGRAPEIEGETESDHSTSTRSKSRNGSAM